MPAARADVPWKSSLSPESCPEQSVAERIPGFRVFTLLRRMGGHVQGRHSVTLAVYLERAAHFARWSTRQRVGFAQINEDAVGRFLN